MPYRLTALLQQRIMMQAVKENEFVQLKLRKAKFPNTTCDVYSADDEQMKFYIEKPSSFSLSHSRILYNDQDEKLLQVSEKILSQVKEMQLKKCDSETVYSMKRKLWVPCVSEKIVEVFREKDRADCESEEIFEIQSRRNATRFSIRDVKSKNVLCKMIKKPRSILNYLTGAHEYDLFISKNSDVALLVMICICIDKYYNKPSPNMLGTAVKTII